MDEATMEKLGKIKWLHGIDSLFDLDYVLHEDVLGGGWNVTLFGHVMFYNEDGVMGMFKSFSSLVFYSL
jgi:hypothetical protein